MERKDKMIPLEELPKKAAQLNKSHKVLVQKIKKSPTAQFDLLCQKLHEEIFEEINCLECGNCCRTLGPRISDKDIEKISKLLKQKPSVVTEQYFRIDEDGDFVFKNMPCPFICVDNYCSIYESRPKACREYPHTDSRKMVQLMPLALKNATVCPAVFEFLERLKKNF